MILFVALFGAMAIYLYYEHQKSSPADTSVDQSPVDEGSPVDSGVQDTPVTIPDNANAPTGIDPGDRSTWPSGDKIWNICQAIAVAEGYGPPNHKATITRNPGDMGLGNIGYGTANESDPNNKITVFPTHEAGWQALYSQVSKMVYGGSHIYNAGMTFAQIAQKWALSWQGWLVNMTNDLGVNPSTVLGDYVNS